MIKAGWSGMMSLPRLLTLDPDGTLRMTMLPETKDLRRSDIHERKAKETLTIPRANGEFVCSGASGSILEFAVYMEDQQLLQVTYKPDTHCWIADGNQIVIKSSDRPVIHGFIDGSVIELNLSERIGYTKRFYYPNATAPDLTIRVTGKGAISNAWEIRPITDNRMTTVVAHP